MYEQGLLKIKKPTDQGYYPNPPSDAWNISSNTWINPYFCWETAFCDGIDENRLVRPKNELTSNMRYKICTIETLLDGNEKNENKFNELCKNDICCNVTVNMYCSQEFFDGLVSSKKHAERVIRNDFKNDQFCGNFPKLKKMLEKFSGTNIKIDELDKFVTYIKGICNKTKTFNCKKTK